MKRLPTFLGASLLALAANLAACTSGKAYAEDAAPLQITLLHDGGCEVRTKKMMCSDVSKYMHDELKLGSRVQCIIDARAAPSYESVQALVEALRNSGCKFGSVNVSKSP
ncbi:MAG TPA: hypothetical protein VGO61_05100 [Steroidobacteraceae bacterium]|jgi:hypothetical protein|nr:hypothetical protein [Steroidobacteraceae bacterium]